MKRTPFHVSAGLCMLLLFCCPLPASSAPVDWARVHEVTLRGVNLIYDLEMARASVVFDTVIAMAPGDPRGYFFKSMVSFWTYTLRNEEHDFQRFMSMSDTVIRICDGLLDQNENDATAHFYLGGIHGYRGMAEQIHGSMVKAVMEGRKGYFELEEAVRLDPKLYDAQMGFGLFRYLVAKIPSGLAWIARIVGFEGDLEGGLASLRLAATKGVYTRSEAAFYLSQFLFSEHRRDQAFELMRSLIQRHPDNTLFLVLYSSWQLREGNLDEALTYIDRASEVNARKAIKYGEEFIHSTRASIAYSRNDFATARTEYDQFLEKHTHRNMVPNFTYYRIAVARDITGDRSGAIEVCRMMKEGNPTGGPNDASLYRRGMELAARPLTAGQIALIEADNVYHRKLYDSSFVYFRKAVETSGNDPDVRLRALYGMQQVYYDINQDTDAVKVGEEAVAIKPIRELWVVPHSYFKLAQSFARLGRFADASRTLDRIEDFDDYDNQKSLERRVQEERAKLKDIAQ
jgi:tetratricopeptide (TPR) repeat protein